MVRMDEIKDLMRDARGNKVLFASHCLLNMNARYLGGACLPDMRTDLLQYAHERNIALVQMPCPEQHAWGGLLKPLMWSVLGSENTLLYKLRVITLPAFRLYTQWRFSSTARSVARQIADCLRAGCQVVGVVGVDGSPSCGVSCRIDLKRAFALYARTQLAALDRDRLNHCLYTDCLGPGAGLYLQVLTSRLKRAGMQVPIHAISLMDEMISHGDAAAMQPIEWEDMP